MAQTLEYILNDTASAVPVADAMEQALKSTAFVDENKKSMDVEQLMANISNIGKGLYARGHNDSVLASPALLDIQDALKLEVLQKGAKIYGSNGYLTPEAIAAIKSVYINSSIGYTNLRAQGAIRTETSTEGLKNDATFIARVRGKLEEIPIILAASRENAVRYITGLVADYLTNIRTIASSGKLTQYLQGFHLAYGRG